MKINNQEHSPNICFLCKDCHYSLCFTIKTFCEDISLVFNSSLETRGIILRKFMFQTIYGQKFFLTPAFVKTEVISIN